MNARLNRLAFCACGTALAAVLSMSFGQRGLPSSGATQSVTGGAQVAYAVKPIKVHDQGFPTRVASAPTPLTHFIWLSSPTRVASASKPVQTHDWG